MTGISELEMESFLGNKAARKQRRELKAQKRTLRVEKKRAKVEGKKADATLKNSQATMLAGTGEPAPGTPAAAPEAVKSSQRTLLIVGAAVFLVLLLAVGGYFLVKK